MHGKKFARLAPILLSALICAGIMTGCGKKDDGLPNDGDKTVVDDGTGMVQPSADQAAGDQAAADPGAAQQPSGTEQTAQDPAGGSGSQGGDSLSISEEPTGQQGSSQDDNQVSIQSGSQGGTQQPVSGTGQKLQMPSGTNIENEVVALKRDVPAIAGWDAYAPGTEEARNEYAVIDYTNRELGYACVDYLKDSDKKIKCIVKGPSVSYNYDITPKKRAVLPLSDGNGEYTVSVYRNVEGDRYASVLIQNFTVKLKDAFQPFERSNQYVNYKDAPKTVLKATEVCKGKTDSLEKVAAIYDYVISDIKYDPEKAQSVQSNYVPNLDRILAEGKGICFDYAAMMAGMLRSQQVPCKLVVGYAGGVYHAWISVWSDDKGWVEGFVYFDGMTWQRMDPTLGASSGSASNDFVGNGSNYSAKYLY